MEIFCEQCNEYSEQRCDDVGDWTCNECDFFTLESDADYKPEDDDKE